MGKKDDDQTEDKPRRTRKGLAEIAEAALAAHRDATTSVADAFVATTKSSREEVDAFLHRVRELDLSKHRAMAEGKLRPADAGISTSLPSEMTTALSSTTYIDRETEARRGHEERIAKIGASGPVKAELLKPIGAFLVILLVAGLSFLTGVRVNAPDIAKVEIPSSTVIQTPAITDPADVESAALPQPTTQALGGKNDEATRLAQQVASLQRDLEAKRTELADLSRTSLDPRSELGGLVRQLEADTVTARQEAATGLFVIQDVRSAQALMAYFWRDTREAVQINGYYAYIDFVWNLDKQIASEFALKVLSSDIPDGTSEASRFIGNVADLRTRDFDVWFTTKLEDAALRDSSTLVRARAKSALERRNKLRQEMADSGRKFDGEE